MVVNMNMRGSEMATSISISPIRSVQVFDVEYTVDVANTTNRELFCIEQSVDHGESASKYKSRSQMLI